MKVSNKIILILITISLLSLVVSAGKSEVQPEKPAVLPAVPAVIEVVFTEGEVLINGKVPEIGDRLGTSFIVQTGKGARCDIVFNSGNALSVGQNALADFDFTNLVASVRLERGGLSSVLKKLSKITDTDSFNVQTANAVAGVRGTSFCVWVDDKSSYICACNGSVRTIDTTGSNDELLEASHHTARLYTKTGSTISRETAAMLHHTDESLQSVASRIGYVIDWNTIDK